jgi:3-oxoacyl-[acyl-carrier protein] reductase
VGSGTGRTGHSGHGRTTDRIATHVTREPSRPRVVLVAGGNRGIGMAVAEAFATKGDRVAVSYRTTPIPGLPSVRCDVTSANGVAAALDEVKRSLGPVEVLVVSTGPPHEERWLRQKDDGVASALDTCLVGTYCMVRQAVRQMFRARQGRIILISSVLAAIGSAGHWNDAVSKASKAALVAFGRSLARDLGSRNLTVNIVAPGFGSTEMTVALPAELRATLTKEVPSRRPRPPTNVADMAIWLASPRAAHVTGAVIPVDGGLVGPPTSPPSR